MTLEINEEERDDIYYSLGLRLGFIETGTTMRAVDAKNCGKPELIRALDKDQRQVQDRIENLMMKVLQCRVPNQTRPSFEHYRCECGRIFAVEAIRQSRLDFPCPQCGRGICYAQHVKAIQ